MHHTVKNGFYQALEHLGYGRWYRAVAGEKQFRGPWALLADAQLAALDSPDGLRDVLNLLVLNRRVRRTALASALGDEAIEWMESNDLLNEMGDGTVVSVFCLLGCFDIYLFVEWPVPVKPGKYVSGNVYLSESSFECARSALNEMPSRLSLDLGCGSGLITLLLARQSQSVVAIDISLDAIKLTRLNLNMNNTVARVIHGDYFTKLLPSLPYDQIVINPPYRIVPPGVMYPNPIARRGAGLDGLDKVRAIVQMLPDKLTQGGVANIIFDLPVIACENLLQQQWDSLRARGCTVDLDVLAEISASDQALISSETCSFLNGEDPLLFERFRNHYADLNISHLLHVKARICKCLPTVEFDELSLCGTQSELYR